MLVEILQAMGTVDITGLLNVDPKLWKSKQLGIVVLGSDVLVPKLFEDGIRQVSSEWAAPAGAIFLGIFSQRLSIYDSWLCLASIQGR